MKQSTTLHVTRGKTEGTCLETDGWIDLSGQKLGKFLIGWFCFLRKIQREVLWEGTNEKAPKVWSDKFCVEHYQKPFPSQENVQRMPAIEFCDW